MSRTNAAFHSALAPSLTLGAIAASVVLIPSMSLKLALCGALAAIPLLLWMLSGASHWIYAFFAAALLLPPFPVALGNSGPHIATVFALAGLWIGILRIFDWRLRVDGLAVSLLSLLLVLLASVGAAAVNSGVEIAAGSLARVALFGITVYIFFFVRDGPSAYDSGWPLLRLLLFAGAGSALFACVDFYFQFPAPAGFGPQFLWLASGVFRRAQGFFYEASTLGNVCAFFLVMIAVAFTRPRSARPASVTVLLIGAVLFACALVLSYSRASLVNLAIALGAVLWLQRARLRATRLVLGAAIAGALGLGVLVTVVPVFTAAYGARLANSVQYFGESPNAVLSGRLANWKLLAGFLVAHPWHALIGVGFKTLAYSDFTGSLTVTDNTYLSMLAETGIAGFAALIALNVCILRVAYRAARRADPLGSFCGTCMFAFWCGQVVQMFSADLLTYWRVLPIYFCVLAMADRE
jgi:O-antigen ligase